MTHAQDWVGKHLTIENGLDKNNQPILIATIKREFEKCDKDHKHWKIETITAPTLKEIDDEISTRYTSH